MGVSVETCPRFKWKIRKSSLTMDFKIMLFLAAMAGSCLTFDLDSVDLVNPVIWSTFDLDDVQKTVALLRSGSNNTGHIIDVFQQAARTVDQTIKKAEIKMQELTERIGSAGITATNVTKEAFEKYDKVKSDVRGARRKLRSLADKTKTACEEMEIYLQGWANEVDNGDKRSYLKEQLTIMEELTKESITLLREAEVIYESSIDNIEGVNRNLRDFSKDMKRMLNTSSQEHETWTARLRGGVYSSSGVLSVGLLVADFMGGFGAFSLVGNAINWGTSIPIVEVNIAKVTKKLEELEALGESVVEDIEGIKTTTGDLIRGLERELDIVSDWKNDALVMDKKLDRIDLLKFERLPLYRDIFAREVVALREAAEEYLNQPVQLFDQKKSVQQERRKRSLSEITVVRNHKRSF